MTDAVLPDCLYIEGFKQAHASSQASMQPGDKVRLVFAAEGMVADGQYGRLRVPWSAVQGLDYRGPVEPEGELRDLSFAVLVKASGLVKALDPRSQPHRWCYLAV